MSFSPTLWQKFVSYFSEISVEKTGSELNPYLEVVLVGGKLMLNSLNGNYSFGGLHTAFQKTFKKLHIRQRNIQKVLILGFGARSVASILTNEYGLDCKITGIERDEKVIALAKKYFSVAENSNLHIIIAEVAEYIDTLHENYDLIIVDVYEDIIVPACCETIQFLQNLNENLAPNGMLVFNKFVFDGDSLASAFQLEKKFINIFTNTFTIKLRGIYSNWMLVATKD